MNEQQQAQKEILALMLEEHREKLRKAKYEADTAEAIFVHVRQELKRQKGDRS